jgi:hypothetical protein
LVEKVRQPQGHAANCGCCAVHQTLGDSDECVACGLDDKAPPFVDPKCAALRKSRGRTRRSARGGGRMRGARMALRSIWCKWVGHKRCECPTCVRYRRDSFLCRRCGMVVTAE